MKIRFTILFLILNLIFLSQVSGGLDNPESEDSGALSNALAGAQEEYLKRLLSPFADAEHKSIDRFVQEMRGPRHEKVQAALVRYGMWHERLTKEMRRHGLPEEFLALVFVESAFKPKALSRSNAGGFWQILPSTARFFKLRRDAFADDRFIPEKATKFGAWYLRELYAQFGDWYIAMAAYNLGRGDMARLIESGAPKDFFEMRDRGLLREETADYVPRILAAHRVLSNPAKYGFTKPTIEKTKYAGLVLRPLTDVTRLEILASVPTGTIRRANPGLRSEYAPPDPGGFHVVVPAKHHEALDTINLRKNAVADWGDLRDLRRVEIKIKRKMTLWKISRDYDTCLPSLRLWNKLGAEESPVPGDRIVLYIHDER
jgi:peptidoglycan lytic transglycosylase D